MKIQFLGAARQVTGSCTYLEVGGKRLLVDCGLFQEREVRARNWDPTPVEAQSIDAVLLTHAHLDHSGRLPRLVREGFQGRILCTEPTVELTELVLEDSARLQQEDVAFKKKRHQREGRESPHPYEPLYTQDDVERTLSLMEGVPYEEPLPLGKGISVRFLDAGHILGSSIVEITTSVKGGERRIVFTGDLGQPHRPIVNDPTPVTSADYVVMESTYGIRDHERSQEIHAQLGRIVADCVERGGNVVIPTFAIERAQEVLVHLAEGMVAKEMPRIMVFLDSPMAVNVIDIYRKYPEYMDDEMRETVESQRLQDIAEHCLRLVRSKRESQAINSIRGSCVIMAGSGMCTGGRIKHHLVHNIGRPGSTIVFVGYQAAGTLGRQIVDGADSVRIFGQMLPVKARIEQIRGLSAHAGRSDLFDWLGNFQEPPRQLMINHGEESTALALADAVRERTGWKVAVPEYLEEITLD